MRIQILSDELASQIAAGEVVERPASVVKELLENSLDANASHIKIAIKTAGKELIEVVDNGIGISSDQLELSLTRHATSKLSKSEDLTMISTLGFRGEALASIASVSKFMISSRDSDSDLGRRLLVDGGKLDSPQAIAAAVGTTVRVEELFYNVPARKKFLKKDTTEKRHIDALVTRYALAYPEVRFQLEQDGRATLNTSGNGDRREVLAAMYNPDIARQMLEVNAEYPDINIKGYISPTSLSRSNRKAMTFFANGRWVQDAALAKAVTQAYHTLLMVGRYPITILFVELSPEKVDVNVHPTKSEVRFEDQNVIFTSVQRAVRGALLAYSPVPTMNTPINWSTTSQFSSNWNKSKGITAGGIGKRNGEAPSEISASENPETIVHREGFPESGVPLLRLIGQVSLAFLVAEGPDGLYLIDQHAAHERILFERIMAQRDTQMPSQALLEPVTIELTSSEVELLDEQIPLLETLGFRIESFGPTTYKIRGMPSTLIDLNPQTAVRVVIEDFEEDETPLQDEIEAKIIARVCKRAAVKAGQVLSNEEQKALLQDLEACQAPRTCPHGRPTMVHLSLDLLERQFGRKGAR